MSDYEFDYTNFNTVMREIFIHRMNKLSGFDPETGENAGQSEHFYAAQKDIQKLRSIIQRNYDNHIKRPDRPPVWAYAMVMYQRYVETGMAWKSVLKTSPTKHYSKARAFYEQTPFSETQEGES